MKTTICHKHGCYSTAVEGCHYCRVHIRLEENWGKRPAAKRKASNSWHVLYNSSRWKKLSRDFLSKYPFCAVCGCPATVADHIQPHRGNEIIFWDENNLQPLCWKHHSAKTLKENKYFKEGIGGEKK